MRERDREGERVMERKRLIRCVVWSVVTYDGYDIYLEIFSTIQFDLWKWQLGVRRSDCRGEGMTMMTYTKRKRLKFIVNDNP